MKGITFEMNIGPEPTVTLESAGKRCRGKVKKVKIRQHVAFRTQYSGGLMRKKVRSVKLYRFDSSPGGVLMEGKGKSGSLQYVRCWNGNTLMGTNSRQAAWSFDFSWDR